MKELSIKEKAKRYDEALHKARKWYDANTNEGYRGIFEDIFSELKESEDEMIRKFIKDVLDSYGRSIKCPTKDILLYEKSVAWLEKQGEQKLYVNDNAKEMFIKALERVEEQNNKGYKLTDCDKNSWWEDFKNYTFCTIEQKPADKIEPKFKIEKEKWYVCTQTYVLRGKIVVIKGQTYQAEKDNVIKGEDGCLFIDRHDGKASEYFRCWTIQDAKDGDVLVNWNNTIYLLKGIEEEVVKFYCYYNTNYEEFNTPIDNNSHLGLTDPQFEHHPATKEQRNLLFQKMKEAGYEWNDEKLELNKIESEIEIPFGAKDSELQEATYYIPKGFHAKIDDDKVVIKQGEKSIAWSEEDKKMFVNIKACLRNANKDYSREVDWLKSIKPQPKNEWSEKDEDIKYSIIDILTKQGFQTQANWLKSLKDRYTWKPSKEQIVALRWVLNNIPYNKHKEEISGLLDQIKGL